MTSLENHQCNAGVPSNSDLTNRNIYMYIHINTSVNREDNHRDAKAYPFHHYRGCALPPSLYAHCISQVVAVLFPFYHRNAHVSSSVAT